ncbi:hypothetical protein K431DRAFT_222601 [Polychaeton citri CBS 116435]|uniref:Membrane-associated proteins in eicosanoid and glutathione metabolism n=1 Tax=Polychaeton citri CBS 116435 TaxID=1314669 RepID=A0A9P4QCG3_9PEZI|nr:hypothetical protein K431DRAFT_222601 [Polychaeton citri CBS 116435]
MAYTFTVPQEYGYVLIVTAGTFFLNTWHGLRASSFRKPAGIIYPQFMASPSQIASTEDPAKKKAMYLLNCAQRAHSNYIENVSSAALSILISGLLYPKTAASLGLGWLFFRAVYAVGYTRADKENGRGRAAGLAWMPLQWGIEGLAAWVGYKVLTG